MDREEIRRERDKLSRQYDRLLPETVLTVVGGLLIGLIAVLAGTLASRH